MKRRRPKPDFAVADMVYRLSRKFEYPDLDTRPPPLRFEGTRGGAPTVVIAASDASELSKSKADFIASGTNDELLLQEVTDSLQSANGGRVLLTEGAFVFSTDGQWITLAGGVYQGLGKADTFIIGNVGGGLVSLSDESVLKDMNIDNAATSAGAACVECIATGYRAENLTLQHNGGYGISMFGIGGGVVEQVTVQGGANGLAGILMQAGNATVKDCHVESDDDIGIDVDGSTGGMILNNTVYQQAVGIHNDSDETRIQGNYVHVNGSGADHCIFIEGGDRNRVEGNYINAGESGTNIIAIEDGGADTTIADNTIRLSASNQKGILAAGTDARLFDNVIEPDITTPAIGIHITGSGTLLVGNDPGVNADYGTAAIVDAGSGTRFGPQASEWNVDDPASRIDGDVVTWDDATQKFILATGGGGGPGSDTDAIHDNVASEIDALSQVTPASDDVLVIEDASDSFNKKKIEAGDLFGSGTDPDAIHDNVAAEIDALTEVTPAAGDWVIIEDASDSFNKKKVDVDNLGGGGGGNVPGWITHLAERMPDETPHADDDFFDDSDFSPWTIQTVSGNATWVEEDGIASVHFDSQSTGDLAAALLPLTSPSAPVTLETAIHAVTARADFYSFGIGFADGTGTGDDIALIRYTTGVTTTGVDAIFQSAGTLTDFAGGVNNNLNDFRISGGFIYMRIVWTGANTFETQISSNGRNWNTIGSSFSRTMTPTHAVLLATAQGGGADGGVASFHYLRRNDNDPT